MKNNRNKMKITRRSLLAMGGSAALSFVTFRDAVFNAATAEEEQCDALFVIRARGMSFYGGRMTLSGTDPNVTYFCDRPCVPLAI